MFSLFILDLLRHLLKRTVLRNDLFVIFHRKFVNGYVNGRTVQRVLVALKTSPFPVFMKKTGKHKRHAGGRTRAISAHLALSALLAFIDAF